VAAYRAARAESSRGSMAGGAAQATATLRATATGEYLDFVVDSWRRATDKGLRTTRPGAIIYAAPQGWSANEIQVKACEDVTQVKVLDRRGRDKTPTGYRLYVQEYTVVRSDDRWKVAKLESNPVQSFEEYECGA
jgi:hypothetical protein